MKKFSPAAKGLCVLLAIVFGLALAPAQPASAGGSVVAAQSDGWFNLCRKCGLTANWDCANKIQSLNGGGSPQLSRSYSCPANGGGNAPAATQPAAPASAPPPAQQPAAQPAPIVVATPAPQPTPTPAPAPAQQPAAQQYLAVPTWELPKINLGSFVPDENTPWYCYPAAVAAEIAGMVAGVLITDNPAGLLLGPPAGYAIFAVCNQ